MPIQLTTPMNVGVVDPNSPYQQAKIVQFALLPVAKRIEMHVQLGNTISGDWAPGIVGSEITVKKFLVEGEDYNTMVSSTSAGAGEVYYDKVSALLYQWLLDKGHYVGTIV